MRVPYAQILIARLGLGLDFWRSGTRVIFEGEENYPVDRPAFLAMNHTDRYNYMPFMHELDRRGLPPAAPWVKGKYYQKPRLAMTLNACSCIPVPSRGFIISLEFKARCRRAPSAEEYRTLRDVVDGRLAPEEVKEPAARELIDRVEREEQKAFLDYFHAIFSETAQAVIRTNREALDYGYHPLVFPQGTRSRRLSKGHVGLAQMSQYLGVPILPIGVSGADKLYPGNSPWSKGGTVTYRIGELLHPDLEPLRHFRVTEPFTPLSLQASQRFSEQFERITGVVMDAINDLVDPEYQYSTDRQSDGVRGVRRFL